MNFEDVIEDCINLMGGGKSLANELNVSPSEVTRIRSHEGKLSVTTINRLLEIAGLEVRPANQENKLKDALKTPFTVKKIFTYRLDREPVLRCYIFR